MSVVAKRRKTKNKKTRSRQSKARNERNPDSRRTNADWGLHGWFTRSAAFKTIDDRDPLTLQNDFLGPTKLVGEGQRIRRVTEVFVSHEHGGDRSVDDESNEEFEMFIAQLDQSVLTKRSPTKSIEWAAPETNILASWFRQAGYDAAVDDEDNLRLTLKARGCDGQVHVRRNENRLRMVMRLGSWSELGETSERAMLHLARQANNHGRLARIAWVVEGNTRRCEAQVDLTGFPVTGLAPRIWPDMLRMSIGGFELALRRLGLELEVLADPQNRFLAEKLIQLKA